MSRMFIWQKDMEYIKPEMDEQLRSLRCPLVTLDGTVPLQATTPCNSLR